MSTVKPRNEKKRNGKGRNVNKFNERMRKRKMQRKKKMMEIDQMLRNRRVRTSRFRTTLQHYLKALGNDKEIERMEYQLPQKEPNLQSNFRTGRKLR